MEHRSATRLHTKRRNFAPEHDNRTEGKTRFLEYTTHHHGREINTASLRNIELRLPGREPGEFQAENWDRDTWNYAENWAVFPTSVGKLKTPCPFFGREEENGADAPPVENSVYPPPNKHEKPEHHTVFCWSHQGPRVFTNEK